MHNVFVYKIAETETTTTIALTIDEFEAADTDPHYRLATSKELNNWMCVSNTVYPLVSLADGKFYWCEENMVYRQLYPNRELARSKKELELEPRVRGSL